MWAPWDAGKQNIVFRATTFPIDFQALRSTVDFTQTYRESFAMLMELNPQGMLPNIGSIANPAGGLFSWSDYFREVDLDDPFFSTLRLGVSTDLSFENSPVSRLTVDLWCNSKASDGATREQHTTLTFTKDAAARQTWDPFVSGEDYEYQYSIYFKGGSTPFVSKRLRSVSKEAVIGSSSDGLLNLDVVSTGVNFEMVHQVVVTIYPVDPTTKRKGAPTRVVLDRSKLSSTVMIPVGSGFTPPYAYEYQLEYILEKDGLVIQRPASLVMDQTSQISVRPPFLSSRTINLVAPGLADGDSVFVELSYTEKNGYSRKNAFTLDSDNPSTSWLLGINDNDGELIYKAVFDLKEGGSLELPPTKARGDVIKLAVGQAQDNKLRVAVDATLIDWEDIGLQAVEVVVTSGTRVQRVTFRLNKLPDEPPELVWDTDGGPVSYTWKAIYTMKNNGKISRVESLEQVSQDSFLFVPNPDDLPLKP